MARVDVGEQFVEQVAPVRPVPAVPQMVVGIDDGQVRLQDRLLAPVEPVLADGEVVGGVGVGGGLGGHGNLGPLERDEVVKAGSAGRI